MSVRTRVEGLASAEDGGDILDYLLGDEGLGYDAFVDVPNGILRGRGQNDWHEVHLVDEDGEGIIRYIELENSGDSASFSELKQHLKRHGSPIDELFTVVARHESDEGPLTSPLDDELTFLRLEQQFSSEDVEVTFDFNYFTLKRGGVEAAYLDYLDSLTVNSGQGRTSLAGNVEEVFSIREVTKSFYKDFGEIFREDLQDAIHGLKHPDENLNAYTRTVVNRVLFLLFIEEKGWLDDDLDYVENRYEEVAGDDEKHVYDDLFEPLFFEALSERGTTESEVLGRIPFLNGGLFERKDIEEDVDIDAAFFDTLLSPETGEDGEPEGFLRRYKISLRESNPSEQELVVDPEFIGRIFEMFMQKGDKEELGTFYTPKPITGYMTKNALKQHLLGETDLTHDEAVSLVSDHTAPDSLTDDQIEAVDDALRSATVLDPAVGSGAFIIAMLEELVAVSEALDESVGDDRSRFQLKEEFIADTLYGVDIDAGGIELCKFRVWLHLMQDLDADHEEFLDQNEEFALPNLGFKFFVGNSLVGEHDPTNVDAQQETLTGGLDETLEEIHEVRSAYQTAHGEEKDRLTERLEQLTDDLDTQLAVEQGDWMTEIAEKAGETFAWTLNIPEVILNGGFDIVIGNPPYRGGERQTEEYVNDICREYSERYPDVFEIIPRMQYDLYEVFIYRAHELTREGGVFSYITNRTFITTGSKVSTRKLLQANQLHDLLIANENTFDASVRPAVFTATKTAEPREYNTIYADGSDASIESYRNLLREATSDHDEVRSLDTTNDVRSYSVPIRYYRESIRNSFFEPTAENLRLFEKFIRNIADLRQTWRDEIRDSKTLEKHIETIESKHHATLSAGDASLLGLLTFGGKGLTTGKNDDYLAYLAGTQGAEEVRERNEEFQYVERNEETYNYMSRVIPEDLTADVESLSETEKREGIPSDNDRVWVPIEKGFRKSDVYYNPDPEYINWSEESLESLRESSGAYIRNKRYYFEEGILTSQGGFATLAARYTNNRVIEGATTFFSPVTDKVSAKYLTALLNSEIIQKLAETFINASGMEVTDVRLLPIVIPTGEERSALEELVDEAIQIQSGESGRDLSAVEDEIDEKTRDIYELPQ